ncbi:hypothetical protein [Otoolea muris]|uniref:hypothetical protein n=1 Tax=Otoolea muris TaxID=2941515 RepID=UPI00203ECBC2|nr:hypothetical protein [Otoolea muris]
MEYNVKLSRPYIRIRRPDGISFGGSQEWFEEKTIRDFGCGLIGAADVLLYVSRPAQAGEESRNAASGEEGTPEIPYEEYGRHVAALKRHFPIIPGFGMPGWFLSVGFNIIFRRQKSPYRARWGIPHRRLFSSIAEMLRQDIPVILSAGPHFPRFWGKEGLTLYREAADKTMLPAAKTRAHYVIVTGMAGEWMRISSWGRMYYIRISEYEEYVRRYSCPLFSNICYIRSRAAGQGGQIS